MKKSYYAIIPANVRYDEGLTPNAKLLYGEITALTNEKGYCWASNSYFAKLYSVKNETISRWISALEKRGYIKSTLIYGENSREIKERRVYINDTPIDNIINTPMIKKSIPSPQNNQYPIDEIVKDNNTVNNTVNNTKEYIAHFEDLWKLYPNKKGKGKISNSKKQEIFKLGDEFNRCIDRYKKYIEVQRVNGFKDLSYQYGSTFFNSGYVDYLDENYVEGVDSGGTDQSSYSKDEYEGLGLSFEDLQEMSN